MWTPKELAHAYAETINGSPNGWGQYTHPVLGRSDYIMWALRRLVGEEESDRLISEAMAAPTWHTPRVEEV